MRGDTAQANAFEAALDSLEETVGRAERLKIAYDLDEDAFDLREAYALLTTPFPRHGLDVDEQLQVAERARVIQYQLDDRHTRLATATASELLARLDHAVELAMGCALTMGMQLEELGVVLRDDRTPAVLPTWLRAESDVSLFSADTLASLLLSIAPATARSLTRPADAGTHYVVAFCFDRVQLCVRDPRARRAPRVRCAAVS